MIYIRMGRQAGRRKEAGRCSLKSALMLANMHVARVYVHEQAATQQG